VNQGLTKSELKMNYELIIVNKDLTNNELKLNKKLGSSLVQVTNEHSNE
jgi:hypothetical protein